MTLAKAIESVREYTRTSISAFSHQKIMEHINEAQKEFAKNIGSTTKVEYVTVTPRFDIQTNYAVRLTIVGGTNEIAATDIAITAADAADQTGTQVATALQVALRAAIGVGANLTVAWSTTEWTFTVDAIDSTSITFANPSGITYISALNLLGLGAETTEDTEVEGGLPTDCTIESDLPTDFLAMSTRPEWDGHQLDEAPLEFFKSPNATGTPQWYHIRNKRIMLYPSPTQQKKLQIWYKNYPAAFTAACGYQECGLSGKALDTATGLSATTTYYFKVTIDSGVETEYSITTAALLTYEDIIDLMNDELQGAEFSLVDGDLRCTSKTLGALSAIALGAGTTGTDLFATLTDFSAFDTAVATEAGDELNVDDEYAEAVVYMASSKIAEKNYERQLADRYYAQFKRIVSNYNTHRHNNNPSVFPQKVRREPFPGVTWP